jgi:hypothetical protein
MEQNEALKTLMTVAAPLIAAATKAFIIPKINSLSDTHKDKDSQSRLSRSFEDYLSRSYEKYSVVNTMVFHNQQKLLKELYVPLTVENSERKKFKIENFEQDFLPSYYRVLITDSAGMGKSTLIKRLFLAIVDQSRGFPILIELRRLSKTKSITDEIIEQLSSITEEIDRQLVTQLIQKGEFIFLLDGFDEIPLDDRSQITKHIQNFVNKANNNLFILTSRPESALSSFGDFKEFKVKGLEIKEAYQLLRKYDNVGTLSRQLIEKLKQTYNQNIGEFLTNPLLVSLLFAAYEHKQTIPLRKHIFYRQVYDALFESHDLTKGDSFAREKYSGLDVDEFHQVLRHIGYNCIIKDRIEFTKDDLLKIIEEAKNYSSGFDFHSSDFFKDLTSTVPLFVNDGHYYKWSHKSLQEYFAAQFILLDSKEKQKEILNKLYRHKAVEKFLNLLDLYYSIDYKSFSEVIILGLLTDYFSHVKNTCKQFRGAHKKIRQDYTFGYDYVILKLQFPESKADRETFAKISECFGKENYQRGWSLNHLPGREDIRFVKVVVSPKPQGRIMQFLQPKKERFIDKPMRELEYNQPEIDLPQNLIALLTDDEKSILNKEGNFERVNRLLRIYNRTGVVIKAAEAKAMLRELKEKAKSASSNLLLEF